ncbi:MAG TPA: response regulator [Chloroflexota bacterium]|jgi:DNA-binding response OmpR family regulator|nr:response regulator [Chloroflexota bacterium]
MSVDLASCVLVVDETPSLGDVLANALERECCAAQVAASTSHALALARERKPDLIIINLVSPSDLLGPLTADPRLRGTPVILIAAGPHETECTTSASVVRVFSKPFYLSDVVAAAIEALGRVARP